MPIDLLADDPIDLLADDAMPGYKQPESNLGIPRIGSRQQIDAGLEALKNIYLGAGHEAGRTATGLINYIPGVNTVNPIPEQEGASFMAGRVAGGALPIIAGGGLARGAAAIPQIARHAPWISEAMQAKGIPRILREIAGGMAYGNITNPEDRLSGTLVGGAAGGVLPSALRGIGAVGKGGYDLAKYAFKKDIGLGAEKTAEQLIESLAAGSKDQIGLARRGAESIAKDYDIVKKAAGEPFERINSAIGNEKVYNNESIQNFASKINNRYKRGFGTKVNSLIDDLQNNKSYSNAHDLYKELGSKQAAIKNNINATPADLDAAYRLGETQDYLKKDMLKMLNKHGLDNEFLAANKIFSDTVGQFRKQPGLHKIAKRQEQAPKELSSHFKRLGAEQDKSMQLLLGEESKKAILADALGAYDPKMNAESLLKNYSKANIQGGLKGYEPAGFNQQIAELQQILEKEATGKELSKNLIKNLKRLGITGAVVGLSGLGGYHASKHFGG